MRVLIIAAKPNVLDIEGRCIRYPHRVSEGLVAAMSRAGCVEASARLKKV